MREVGAELIRLGAAKEGEFLGEMGVLEGRPRSATVRAASALEVELIGRQASSSGSAATRSWRTSCCSE